MQTNWTKQFLLATSLLAILIGSTSFSPTPWGFFAHKRINRWAVFTLPSELIGFYKKT